MSEPTRLEGWQKAIRSMSDWTCDNCQHVNRECNDQCFVCDARSKPKGETGIWRCAAHSKPVEDDLVKIVNALSMAAKRSGI